MTSPTEQRIEVVWRGLDPELSNRLVDFWVGHGVLGEAAARQRLAEVICVLFDRDGEIAGVNSAYAAQAPLVGRSFWIYRRFLASAADAEAERLMIKAARDVLARQFSGAPDEPLGFCVLIQDRLTMERYPEAEWADVGMLFAGYTPEGVQVRIGYFEGARI